MGDNTRPWKRPKKASATESPLDDDDTSLQVDETVCDADDVEDGYDRSFSWGRKRTSKSQLRHFSFVRNDDEITQAGYVYRKMFVVDVPMLRSGEGLNLLKKIELAEFIHQDIPNLEKQLCDEFISSYDCVSKIGIVEKKTLALDVDIVAEALKLPIGGNSIECEFPHSPMSQEQKDEVHKILNDASEKKNKGHYDLGQLIYEDEPVEIVACIISLLMIKLECNNQCFHYASPELMLATDRAIRGVKVQWASHLTDSIHRGIVKARSWRHGTPMRFPYGEWLTKVLKYQLDKKQLSAATNSKQINELRGENQLLKEDVAQLKCECGKKNDEIKKKLNDASALVELLRTDKRISLEETANLKNELLALVSQRQKWDTVTTQQCGLVEAELKRLNDKFVKVKDDDPLAANSHEKIVKLYIEKERVANLESLVTTMEEKLMHLVSEVKVKNESLSKQLSDKRDMEQQKREFEAFSYQEMARLKKGMEQHELARKEAEAKLQQVVQENLQLQAQLNTRVVDLMSDAEQSSRRVRQMSEYISKLQQEGSMSAKTIHELQSKVKEMEAEQKKVKLEYNSELHDLHEKQRRNTGIISQFSKEASSWKNDLKVALDEKQVAIQRVELLKELNLRYSASVERLRDILNQLPLS